jgi:Reverse transcriptase (RNA-dependent DNA polymerase)
MTLRQGFEDGSRKICKLRKIIHGLKLAARIWLRRLREHLSTLSFNLVAYTECIFERGTNVFEFGGLFMLMMYIISKSTARIQVKSELEAKMKINNLGPATYFSVSKLRQ